MLVVPEVEAELEAEEVDVLPLPLAAPGVRKRPEVRWEVRASSIPLRKAETQVAMSASFSA